MKREPVSSSNLASIGYENETLEVEFLGGGIYQYHNVPEREYLALMSASSHGQYFDRNIKKGGYGFTKIK